jgi:hypothetical protein
VNDALQARGLGLSEAQTGEQSQEQKKNERAECSH